MEADNGWRRHCRHVTTIDVPGDHDSMVLEPHVRVLWALGLPSSRRAISDRLRSAQPASDAIAQIVPAVSVAASAHRLQTHRRVGA